MGLTANLAAITSGIGALQSGTSSGGSQNSSSGSNQSTSYSFGNTYGREASQTSQQSAQTANAEQWNMMQAAMEFNAREAQKQRDWQTEMANTIYTRSVKNMIEAGINPILAASMGLSGANVGSGSTANISTPSAFMGQTFAEQTSASQGQSSGTSYSKGSSWESSRYGVAEGLEQLAELIQTTIDNTNSASILGTLGDKARDAVQGFTDTMKKNVDGLTEGVLGRIKDLFNVNTKKEYYNDSWETNDFTGLSKG